MLLLESHLSKWLDWWSFDYFPYNFAENIHRLIVILITNVSLWYYSSDSCSLLIIEPDRQFVFFLELAVINYYDYVMMSTDKLNKRWIAESCDTDTLITQIITNRNSNTEYKIPSFHVLLFYYKPSSFCWYLIMDWFFSSFGS